MYFLYLFATLRLCPCSNQPQCKHSTYNVQKCINVKNIEQPLLLTSISFAYQAASQSNQSSCFISFGLKVTVPNSKDFIKCDLECCTSVFFKGKYTKEGDINRCIKSYWRSSEVLHSRKARRLTSNLSWSVKGCRNNKICMKNIEIMRTSNLNGKLMCLMI